jgi:hypothetical protein
MNTVVKTQYGEVRGSVAGSKFVGHSLQANHPTVPHLFYDRQ